MNNAQCCTPSLLLPNGDAWELDRCDCHDSTDPDYPINCGGTATDELLMGYLFYRSVGGGVGGVEGTGGGGRHV